MGDRTQSSYVCYLAPSHWSTRVAISIMSFPLCAALYCSPHCCGCTTHSGVRCNGKASFSDTTGSQHWRCVCVWARVCAFVHVFVHCICVCMREVWWFVPSFSQGVHTETVFELVRLNWFTETGFEEPLAFTLFVWNQFRLHLIVYLSVKAASTVDEVFFLLHYSQTGFNSHCKVSWF